MTLGRLLHVLRALVERVVTAPFYVILHILMFLDDAARWSDRHFNTKFRKPKFTVPELEKLIDTNLPIGASISEVLSFLKAHNFLHSEVVSENVYGRSSDFQYSKLDGKRESIKKAIASRIDVGGSLLVKGVLQTTFYFDDHDSLLVYTVQWFGIGL